MLQNRDQLTLLDEAKSNLVGFVLNRHAVDFIVVLRPTVQPGIKQSELKVSLRAPRSVSEAF